MATTKKRLNISLAPDVEVALAELSKRDSVPQATKASALLRVALELEEDIVFDTLAAERYKTSRKKVSHKDAWK